jgi:hypothetical protein
MESNLILFNANICAGCSVKSFAPRDDENFARARTGDDKDYYFSRGEKFQLGK